MLKTEDKFLIVTSYDENDPTIAKVRMNDARQAESNEQGYIELTSFTTSDQEEWQKPTN